MAAFAGLGGAALGLLALLQVNPFTLLSVAAIVLGILALSGVDPMTLTLIAALSMGASTLLSGSSLAGRVFSLFG